MAKGTLRNLASVWARSVFPDPVGPARSILLFSSSMSFFDIFLFEKILL